MPVSNASGALESDENKSIMTTTITVRMNSTNKKCSKLFPPVTILAFNNVALVCLVPFTEDIILVEISIGCPTATAAAAAGDEMARRPVTKSSNESL